jgi:hypothetical protein
VLLTKGPKKAKQFSIGMFRDLHASLHPGYQRDIIQIQQQFQKPQALKSNVFVIIDLVIRFALN